MATDYLSLVSEITAWSPDRANDINFIASIPGFITDAETMMNGDLNIRWMESIITTTITDYVNGFVGLPADYISLKSVELLTDPPSTPNYVTPETLAQNRSGYSLNYAGNPNQFTEINNTLQFFPVPSASSSPVTVKIIYAAKIPTLVPTAPATTATNLIIANCPLLYRAATMIFASLWARNPDEVSLWKAAYTEELNRVKQTDNRSEYPSFATFTLSSD